MKKNELIEKKQKMAKKEYKNKATVLNDSMKVKFENVAKAKISSKADYHERLREIHDRRSLKEEKKEKVLKSVDLNHQMLKEVHSLRAENVKNNLQKQQLIKKQYQEELAVKLEI